MHTVLLVFEFLGTTELLVIAVVALILFGPRKLPEIGRTVGKGIAEFKRASDDFKRTWEYEVELDRRRPAPDVAGGAAETLPPEGAGGGMEAPAGGAGDEEFAGGAAQQDAGGPTVARGSSSAEDEAKGGAAAEPSNDDAAWGAAGGVANAHSTRAEEDEINAS
jgi:sec-independent protein translocase protein TatA